MAKAKMRGPQGPIERGAVYPLSYLNWGNYAIRTAKANGFRVFEVAGRAMFSGDDFLEYTAKLPTTTQPPPRPDYKARARERASASM